MGGLTVLVSPRLPTIALHDESCQGEVPCVFDVLVLCDNLRLGAFNHVVFFFFFA